MMLNSNKSDQLLKSDTFGSVSLRQREGVTCSVRNWADAAPVIRWLAARLGAREARALAVASELPGIPDLLSAGEQEIEREWLPGAPMQKARPTDPRYFREALRLLRRMHRLGIAHNDLAKEPNWLVLENGDPGIIDFQLATVAHRRHFLFRLQAREDLRHLLKHKRTYCPDKLSARQRKMLAKKALPTRIWMATGKPVYLFVTRRLLGWSDREGAGDRGAT